MSKRFDINYFLGDAAVKNSLEQYEGGDVENAIYNMELITRAYGIAELLDAESVLKACINHPLRNPV